MVTLALIVLIMVMAIVIGMVVLAGIAISPWILGIILLPFIDVLMLRTIFGKKGEKKSKKKD